MKKILLFLFILCSFAGSAQLSPTQIYNMSNYSGNMTNGVLVVSYTSGGSIFGRKISMRALLDSVAGVTWNGISDPTGDQTLTFGAGETSFWTNQNTTDVLLAVQSNSQTSGTTVALSSSSLTGGNLLSLVSTSTAHAAGQELAVLTSNGTNANSSVTTTGLRSAVTNTGTTSVNNGAVLSASGASVNFALYTGAGTNNDGRVFINNATNDANFTVGIRGVNDNGANGILKLSANNESASMQFGYNTITGSAGMNLSTPAGAITFSTTGAAQNINSTANVINMIASVGASFGSTSFTPTARIHTAAQTTAAGTSQWKMGTGTDFMTSSEDGAWEYIGIVPMFSNSLGRGYVVPSLVRASSGTESFGMGVSDWVFTGTTATWSLPALSGTSGQVFYVKNRGSGNLTIDITGAPGSFIFKTIAVASFILVSGSSARILSDGTFWNVFD